MDRLLPRRRLRLDVTGAVQGVGFRPFVHRLAVDERLVGFVRNTGQGASIEVEGTPAAVEQFLNRLDAELQLPAAIGERTVFPLEPRNEIGFVIAPSESAGDRPPVVLPDLATCPDCLAEILDPADRRYRYPFTTCTRCGPRYSIIEAVPYDRARTVMRHFPMCPACRAEYDDFASRRFHAETNACPACGPRVTLLNARGDSLADGDAVLPAAVAAIAEGRIVALKGLGGFQLLADAADASAIARLRERKRRPAKPFAVMVATLADAQALALVGEAEAHSLASSAAPIVLLPARADAGRVAPCVAPDNPLLGIMLPATPLHHLLARALGRPVIATSGNRGGEPIATDAQDALRDLEGIADMFLVHDRPIARAVDDSVVRMIAGRETVLRHARGFAPQPFAAPGNAACLALGGHQKDAVALGVGGKIILGPHIGDLGTAQSRAALRRSAQGMTELYRTRPAAVACDGHRDYHSTRLAEQLCPSPVRVPHHLAHVLAGMVDNSLNGPVLGVAWDGTGDGGDGTAWGGEILAVGDRRWRRAAHLTRFRLPGGEAAVREPRRAALGALHAVVGDAALTMTDLPPVAAFSASERTLLLRMLGRGLNAPMTSSAGRLFDAVAAILGLGLRASFEGEAAMAVEFAADRAGTAAALPAIGLQDGESSLILDWRPMLRGMVAARRDGISADALAAGFHGALADAIIAVAERVGWRRVLLTGGCFQNARLSGLAIGGLKKAGFEPFWHHRIPPNDGGIAAGQAAFALSPRVAEEK